MPGDEGLLPRRWQREDLGARHPRVAFPRAESVLKREHHCQRNQFSIAERRAAGVSAGTESSRMTHCMIDADRQGVQRRRQVARLLRACYLVI
jgi:hypothetical protein